MLIPKLFLGLASAVGVGSLASFSSFSSGGGDPTIWKVDSSNSPFPLFSCSNYSNKILISLKFEDNSGTKTTGSRISFHGYEQTSGQEVKLNETLGTGTDIYKLTIWQSGGSRLVVPLPDSSKYGADLQCDTSVFKVTNYDHQAEDSSYQSWEKGFKDIQLTLGTCSSRENSKQECEIKISEEANLEWADSFKPRVILN